MAKVRNETWHFTIKLTEIKRIIRECYEQLYANKFSNLDEMDNFLEKYKLPIFEKKYRISVDL